MGRSFLALLALIAGCSGGEAPATDTAVADGPRDTLVVAINADINSLNVVTSASATDAPILDALNYGLLDAEFKCGLHYIPQWATEWSWSEDGKVLSMTLHDGLKWSDGTPVTPEDLVFTSDLLADPAVQTARTSNIERMEPTGRPKVIDATHIEWHFTEAYNRDTQLSHTSLGFVPKHILKDADRATLNGHEFSHNPVVNGPFKLAKYEPGQRIVLEPNENFTGPAEMKPRLNRVIFKVIPEYSTRLLELQNGSVDMMDQISVADADILREQYPNIKLYRRGYRGMDSVAWNIKNPKFSDLRVRKALAMAVDVDNLIAKLLTAKSGEAYATRAVGTVTPAACDVHNSDIKPIEYNVEQAKALLAEAGWADTNNNGTIDKDGKEFEFTMITNADNKRRGEAAIRLQSSFQAVGVKMNIEKLEFNTMTERLKNRDFEAAVMGWAASLILDMSPVWSSDLPDRKRELNYTAYSNPEVDALISQAIAATDPAVATPLWREAQAKIYEDQPYLFLYWMDEIVGVDSRFTTVNTNISSRLFHLYDWEVDPTKVKYPR